MKVVALNSDGDLVFFYPACGHGHGLAIAPNRNRWTGAQWTWNGNFEKPTANPSVVSQNPHCHLFMVDGKLQYLADCEHSMAGQTVEMTGDWLLGDDKNQNESET